MLTMDDCNTILEKYGKTGFWYEIDFSKFWDGRSNKTWNYDFGTINAQWYNSIHMWVVTVSVTNSLSCKVAYVKDSQDNYQSCNWNDSNNSFVFYAYYDAPKMYIYLTTSEVIFPETYEIDNYMFIPVSQLSIPVINGVYDNRWYFKKLTIYPGTFLINGESATVHSDSNGTYLELNSIIDSVIGFKQTQSGKTFTPYTVRFQEFKTIPTMSISSLYKGTPQEIQLYNEDTQEYITEFQAYYQGRKLKDNIITLNYGCEDMVDIVIDILDPKYPTSRVKLKAMTEYCIATSQAELETAIEGGIRTVKVINGTSAVNIEEIELADLTLIDSKINLYDSVLDNITILNSTISFADTPVNNSIFTLSNIISSTNEGEFNNCNITQCSLMRNCVIQFTGTLKNSQLEGILIISDGNVEIIDNNFKNFTNMEYEDLSKPYFPNFLYLTGEYVVKGNKFKINAIWEEPAFNMCIIKTIDPFTANDFIANNTFDLNIVIDDEPTDTFYYNIVDDDKIKAVRLN